MGLVGNEIVQSITWIDPNADPAPNLNYKNTFPITVFDAVRQEMDSEGPTLTEVLASIDKDLQGKQPLIPAKPANYLMTFAGAPGAVGAIKLTQSIPVKLEDQRSDVVPTEKAVGDLLSKLGLIDSDGNTNIEIDATIRWSQVIGRPNSYQELGTNTDGFITQDVVTRYINDLQGQITSKDEETDGLLNLLKDQISKHVANMNNPHNVTTTQIGAATKDEFDFHISAENPHNVTKAQVGLSHVDNTSDLDKPISNAVQDALDDIKDRIQDLVDETGTLNFVTNVTYDRTTEKLNINFRNNTKASFDIPINNLVSDVSYDSDTKKITVTDLNGATNEIDLTHLYTNYVGSVSPEINVSIQDKPETNQQVIKAEIGQHGITTVKIANEAIDARTIKEGAVTSIKIRDGAISSIKIAAGAVTSDKIGQLAVTSTKIADRAIDGRTLFSSQYDNRVLLVNDAGTDPVWSQITGNIIAADSINTEHIVNNSITNNKIVAAAITSSKIDNGAVTTNKIADRSITNEKIASNTIEGIKLVNNITLSGTPTITEVPAADSDSKELATTSWIRDFVSKIVLTTDNIDNRAITADKLFTSPVRDRVLGVTNPNADPVWTTITHGMLNDDIIDNSNIRDLAVTASKISDNSIEHRHLTAGIVDTTNIIDSAVTSEKLWVSPNKNVVLGVTKENSHPVYTTINGEMIDDNAISTNKIQDLSVTPSKMTSSSTSHRLMGVTLAGSTPQWTQATNGMIGDRAVDGRTLFSSPQSNMVLVTTSAGTDPAWSKISTEMIGAGQVQSLNIAEGCIQNAHLAEKIIEAKHIRDWSITSNNIAPRAITGVELFTSPIPNRVLAVTSTPYSNPDWLQITTDMIEDCAITKEKIFLSDNPYRVLATTQANTPPEYIKITGDFIVDDSIPPEKLIRDIPLYGTPELTVAPDIDADNFQLANTAWVRQVISNVVIDTINKYNIEPHSIDGTKLMTSDEGPRVLGVTAANQDVEFLLIEENLIADGAVTSNKIQRDVHLMGSPIVEVRPAPNASDDTGMGTMIPDCQWVLDRIAEAQFTVAQGNSVQAIPVGELASIMDGDGLATISDYEISDDGSLLKGIAIEQIPNIVDSTDDIENNTSTTENGYTINAISDEVIDGIVEGTYDVSDQNNIGTGGVEIDESGNSGTVINPGGSSITITTGSIVTDYIQNRAVTGTKLFTSTTPNMVLAVTASNSDPAYVKVTSDMIEHHNVTGKNLFTSDLAYRVLVVKDANSNAEWGQIEGAMIADNGVTTNALANFAVTNNKIANESITANKLIDGSIINTQHIFDNAVTTDKIATDAVQTVNIKDKSITSSKLNDEIELPAKTTVKEDNNYERRAVRNTILSPNAPSDGMNGDIWFRYV